MAGQSQRHRRSGRAAALTRAACRAEPRVRRRARAVAAGARRAHVQTRAACRMSIPQDHIRSGIIPAVAFSSARMRSRDTIIHMAQNTQNEKFTLTHHTRTSEVQSLQPPGGVTAAPRQRAREERRRGPTRTRKHPSAQSHFSDLFPNQTRTWTASPLAAAPGARGCQVTGSRSEAAAGAACAGQTET